MQVNVQFSDQYPAIKAFVRGYLHQDAVAEYVSAERAAERFCHDADRSQTDQLRSEWTRFRSHHVNLEDINSSLEQLGCAWRFESTEEFRRMIHAFISPHNSP
jgi:hypothetical protein